LPRSFAPNFSSKGFQPQRTHRAAGRIFYFTKTLPEVDWYSGIIYQAMGLPVAMSPMVLAMPRTVSGFTVWHEIVAYAEQEIMPPRQIFDGHSRYELPT
jgi:citrate synthase